MSHENSNESGNARAVIYLRVSTKEQADREGDPEGYSIPAQRDACARKAASLGADVVKEFVDRGESARSAARPQLQAMLAFVSSNPGIDFAIVHKVDRLARNRLDDVQINLALNQAGTRLVSVSENIDQTPSGLLLHGIMSDIAEFYSRNLAAEVTKGMNQKVKGGGTAGLAPIGYLNVRAISSEGREIRTVSIDPERAPMVTWAFEAYATGDWTALKLAGELQRRGLTTRATPKRPSVPLSDKRVLHVLRSPYYKGFVSLRGASHRGRHEPLVSDETWQRVQDILTSRRPGEKAREHPHYLKSTVHCGGCSRRLIVSHAKNRYGVVYPYFICLGRHGRRNACTRKAVLIASVEAAIERYYGSFELEEELRTQLRASLQHEFRLTRKEVEQEEHSLAQQRDSLEKQQMKLLQAHYADALPVHLLKVEQERLGAQLTAISRRLAAIATDFASLDVRLEGALRLLGTCGAAYAAASDTHRRRLNQSLFDAFYVEDEGVRAVLAEPFRSLLPPSVIAETGAPGDVERRSLTEAVEHALTVRGTNKPALSFSRAGLKQVDLVPRVGVEPTLGGF